jgi:homocysteine S-methyltransferase
VKNPVLDCVKERHASGNVILLPTGMGSEVAETTPLTKPLFTVSALLTTHGQEAISQVHHNHARNGNDFTTTATWTRTTAFAEVTKDWEAAWRENFLRAIKIARTASQSEEARSGHRTYVGLSIGPHDDSEKPQLLIPAKELYDRHLQTGLVGAEGKADANIYETLSTRAETLAAANAGAEVYKRTGVPFIISLKPGADGGFPDGRIGETVAQIRDLPGLAAIGLNCILPSEVAKPLTELRDAFKGAILVYANGDDNHCDHKHHQDRSRQGALAYAQLAQGWVVNDQVAGVGGCCGTITVPHGRELARVVEAIRAERGHVSSRRTGPALGEYALA